MRATPQLPSQKRRYQGCLRRVPRISYSDMKLIVEDADGPAGGGEFMSDTLDLKDLPKQQIGAGQHWSSGKYELNADIKLKKKP